MATQHSSKLFRERSLRHLQSPERLDQLLRVTALSDWIPLGALAALSGVVVIWSIVGRIPLNVMGQGALIFPHAEAGEAEVEQFSAHAAGQISDLRVKRGDLVRKGQLLAVIDLPEVRKQLEQARQTLAQLQQQHDTTVPLEERESAVSRAAAAEQRAALQSQLHVAQALGPQVLERQLASVHAQRLAANAKLKDGLALEATMKKVRDRSRALHAKGLIADSTALESEKQYLDAVHQVADLKSQMTDLASKELDARKAYLDNQSKEADLQAQLANLDTQQQKDTLGRLQQDIQTQNAIADAERKVGALENQLRHEGLIESDYDGRILEVDAVMGQQMQQGTKLGAIQVMEPGIAEHASDLQAVAYFAVSDGKRIQPGMRIAFTPATVKQVEFGGITGVVTHVSAFEVSKDSAANMVNSMDVATQVMNNGKNTIEVIANLDADTRSPSGYKWSASKGPNLKMTAGTTGQMQVTVEKRAPISLVLPFLRTMSGL